MRNRKYNNTHNNLCNINEWISNSLIIIVRNKMFNFFYLLYSFFYPYISKCIVIHIIYTTYWYK